MSLRDRVTTAVWQSGPVTMAQAGDITDRVLAALGVVQRVATPGDFYEANRQLIRTHREATRSILELLNAQYREDHAALCKEHGNDAIKDLWA